MMRSRTIPKKQAAVLKVVAEQAALVDAEAAKHIAALRYGSALGHDPLMILGQDP
jgi:hypothetical protein